MTTSTTSGNHARLIREMSKAGRKSSRASDNSDTWTRSQPTKSDFDPENEAIMSTRRIDDEAQNLPDLRANTQKYSRFSNPSRHERHEPQTEPDYAINTSAIGRAFPDFSQGGSSSDESDISIEIGRGGKASGRVKDHLPAGEFSEIAPVDLGDDSLDLSVPMIGSYEVTRTPPMNSKRVRQRMNGEQQQHIGREKPQRQPSALRHEIPKPIVSAVKTKDSGSSESGNGSGKHLRSLTAMHARVRDEDELSHISDERPPTIDLTFRNTRFAGSNGQSSNQVGAELPTKYHSAKGLVGNSTQSVRGKSNHQTGHNPGTQQSFVLPDMPNISELISGVYGDGTPVFSRHGKARSARFRASKPTRSPEFAGVSEVPVPEEEQAIFLSLKLLQDKVSTLEKENAEAQGNLQELRQQNARLEVGIRSGHKSSSRVDSALGTTDSEGGDDLSRGRKATIEKNRLEASNRALIAQLDASNRKFNTAETILRNITQERDSAVSQLSLAYITIEQLKAENEDLRAQALQIPMTKAQNSSRPKTEYPSGNSKQKTKHAKVAYQQPVHSDRASGQGTQAQAAANTKPITNNGFALRDSDDTESCVSDTSEVLKPEISGKAAPSHHKDRAEELSKNLTYLSFLDGGEVAKLRRTLEEERLARKQRQTAKTADHVQHAPTMKSLVIDHTQNDEPPIHRKSSLKDATVRSSAPAYDENALDTANHGKEHTRRHSETSMLSTRGLKRTLNKENLTSAFIVPDITFRLSEGRADGPPALSRENQAILDELANHKGQDCIVCQRESRYRGECAHAGNESVEIPVPKPIPVSQRNLAASAYEEEPTMRPAQAPGLALATVIKALEDEIKHLKLNLARYQALYNGHDPALSKRRRKSVSQRMESLVKDIEIKSDQIYSLYDVLEGQKQDGHEMSDHEIEVTLQSVGVDPAEIRLRGGGDDKGDVAVSAHPRTKGKDRAPWDLGSDDGSEDELPWEGIESTANTTRSGFAHTKYRVGTTA